MSTDATALLPGLGLGGATFSLCRRYRYRLWRSWGAGEHRVVFLGLNPSKADEHRPDMSVTKSVTFAKRWSFSRVDWVNVFGLVSTDPTGLLDAADPVGPENFDHLRAAFHGAHRIVMAWGSHNRRINEMVRAQLARPEWRVLIPAKCEVGTLGRTQDGSPRHPSRLAYATRFEAE